MTTTAPPGKHEGLTGPEIAETLAWICIFGHVVHWAVDALYYIVTQVSYFTKAKHGKPVLIFGSDPPGDWWDRLPVHVDNVFGMDWFGSHALVPQWWVTGRHDARYVVIGVLTGVVVFFLASRPRKVRKDYRWYRMAATPALALLYAVPGVAVGALAIWKVQWLHAGGITMPSSWGLLGNEIDQWSASGHPALLVLGLLGAWCFARFASLGPADEAQWVYAERRASRILRERTGRLSSIGNFADTLVIGPPGYRKRVRFLVGQAAVTGQAGTGMVVVLGVFMFLMIILAGYGAYLTLAGAAAGA